jgi:CRISPR-associated protein Csb2
VTTTLVIRFPLGLYHATPWGRHVNEGQVEFPPSPWRLLRALYAVWQGRRPELDEGVVLTVLAKLAEPPTFYVPPHTIAHSRHWLPDSRHRTATASTDRTLDAFAVVDRSEALVIQWRSELTPEEQKALAELADALPYLGRAESICEATLDMDGSWAPGEHKQHSVWAPLDVSEAPDDRAPAATLLAPTLPLDIDALLLRPVDVRAGKLLFPASTRFVAYSALIPRPSSPHRRTSNRRIEAFRFTITNGVRPPHTEAVTVADFVRRTALSRLDEGRRDTSLLAGRDAAENKLELQHLHAHYLVLVDDLRRLNEIVVWVPAGLEETEAAAVASLRRIGMPPEVLKPNALNLRMAAYGSAEDVLGDLRGKPPAGDRVWRSSTPFAPYRHTKRDWSEFLASEANRELAQRGLPRADVKIIEPDGAGWQSFVRYRPTRRFSPTSPDRRPAGPGAHLQLTFDEPVFGPIAIGHLSHFGLGLFLPGQRQ